MKIRINNIGVRPPTYIGKQPENAKHTLSIVQYYPNKCFSKLKEYLANGWEDSEGNDYIRKNNCTMGKTMFDLEELCVVIAYIIYDPDELCTDLKSVGERILDLSEDDRKDFFGAYKIATNKMKEIFKEQ